MWPWLIIIKQMWIKLKSRALGLPVANTESQNHRIVGVGSDLCGSSSPTLLPKQGHRPCSERNREEKTPIFGLSWFIICQNVMVNQKYKIYNLFKLFATINLYTNNVATLYVYDDQKTVIHWGHQENVILNEMIT